MPYTLYNRSSHGTTNAPWLQSTHVFNFNEFYDQDRERFGVLRVFNDDVISPGTGFGMHPHANFEIVTVVLSGSLEHEDSMGNKGIIQAGEVQRMSAGTGVWHAEQNPSKTVPVHLLQIWLAPNQNGLTPSYEQRRFGREHEPTGGLVKIVDGISKTTEKKKPLATPLGALSISQDAVFLYGDLRKGVSLAYTLENPKHGVFAYLISGKASLNQYTLESGDGLGISDVAQISLTARSASKLLLIEVPLESQEDK
jgi:quercetin 2,3-dioxygenase